MAASSSSTDLSTDDLAFLLLSSSCAVVPRLPPPPPPQPPSTSSYRLSPEDTRLVMRNFSHDQLLSILNAATLRSVDVVEAVQCIVDLDRTRRQLFVGNLNPKTTPSTLFSFFSFYGHVDEAIVIHDRFGNSRKFGFVTFGNIHDALRARKHMNKKIDGYFVVTEFKRPHRSDVSGAVGIMKSAFDWRNEAVERAREERQEMKKENNELRSNLDKVFFALFVVLLYVGFLVVTVLIFSLSKMFN